MAASNGTQSSFPSPEATPPSSITRKGFRITTKKLPILKAGPIDEMTNKLGIAPPEMIFGDNLVSIEHIPSGWGINFNAFDALDRVDKTGASMLKVSYSSEWQKSRCAISRSSFLNVCYFRANTWYRESAHEGIKEVVKPFDWSYTTDYKGTVTPKGHEFEQSSTSLPIERLKQPDPILFYDEIMLYEDELADNGITMLSCKIRVMPTCLLLLTRMFMRLDNVLFRLRDTRVFVDFDTGEVMREYLAKEEGYDKVKEVSFTLLVDTAREMPY